jgi:aspartate dehydrogenase
MTLGGAKGTREPSLNPLRVSVIGFGAIGAPIVRALLRGHVPGCVMGGVLTRSSLSGRFASRNASSLDDLIERSDIIVEAAGHSALTKFGPTIIDSGIDLIVLSVGALVDDHLLDRLSSKTGGRLMISTGAVGGLDTLLAAMLVEPLESISLISRKPAHVLIHSWMSAKLRESLSNPEEEVEAFSGTARTAVRLFPESANVAATVALATLGFDRLAVRIIGTTDPSRVEHRIVASGSAGFYEFSFRNRPSDTNPRTSAITPYSVIRALRRLRERTLIGI